MSSVLLHSPSSAVVPKVSSNTQSFAPQASSPPHALLEEQMALWYQLGEGGSSITLL